MHIIMYIYGMLSATIAKYGHGVFRINMVTTYISHKSHMTIVVAETIYSCSFTRLAWGKMAPIKSVPFCVNLCNAI